MKPPKFKRTHEFFAGLRERFSSGELAKWTGVSIQTVDAWCRRPESNEYPQGTGKRNWIDALLRILGKVHEKDPGFAREWASLGVEYVDFLDGKQGQSERATVCELAAYYLKEHAEMVGRILAGDGDPDKLWREVAECEAAFNQLKSCIKEQMKGNITDIGRAA